MPEDLSKLCLHTITTRPWNIEQAARHYSAGGVKGITVWRDALEGRNIAHTGQMLRDQGLAIVSLCRGGFFAHKDSDKRKAALEDNRKAIEEAAALGTNLIVLVCGADPSAVSGRFKRANTGWHCRNTSGCSSSRGETCH